MRLPARRPTRRARSPIAGTGAGAVGLVVIAVGLAAFAVWQLAAAWLGVRRRAAAKSGSGARTSRAADGPGPRSRRTCRLVGPLRHSSVPAWC